MPDWSSLVPKRAVKADGNLKHWSAQAHRTALAFHRSPSVLIGSLFRLSRSLIASLSLYNIFLQQNGQAISYTSWYCRMLYGEIMLQSIYLFLGGLVLCSNLFQIGDAWIRTLHSLILSSIANHDYIQSNAYSLWKNHKCPFHLRYHSNHERIP